MQRVELNPREHLNGTKSSSTTAQFWQNFEESESNNHLRKFVRNGKLGEGFKFLQSMLCRGEIQDAIACTSLIRGFCKTGKTLKVTRVMDSLEDFGVVPDVITYNVLIGEYHKSVEIDNAIHVLDQMSIAPDVVAFNTILCTLCNSGKLNQAMEVLDRQLQWDVITYTILIGATCKKSGVGQAMKLLR